MTLNKITLKRIALLTVALIYTSTFSISVFAVDKDFYSSNNIQFYDASDTESSCLAGVITLSGDDNREKIYNFLTAKGLSPEQAAGVLGNIERESGYGPMRHEQSHSSFSNGGYGLAQWTYGRRTTLEKYLKDKLPDLYNNYYKDEYGGAVSKADGYVARSSVTKELMPIGDNDAFLGAELEFLFDETSSRKISASTERVSSAKRGENEWDALRKATSIEDATKIWLYNFEIPADIAQAAIDRTASAQNILIELQEKSTTALTSSSNCVDATSGDTSALQATVKKYAWPSYHGPPYVTLKPEYDKAVKDAMKAGKYVGGIKYKGVDCGGFVTRVMIDSGYEPDYNSGNGPTAVQRAWLDSNWEKLGTGSTIDVASLKPGDVAMKTGHTFMFAGTNIDGFGTSTSRWKGVASASLDERSPMAGVERLDAPELSWYRKKVVSHE